MPVNLMKQYLMLTLLLTACGTATIKEKIKGGTDGSLSLLPGAHLYVAAAFFTDPVGSIATLGLNNPHSVNNSLAITDSSDVVVRSGAGRLYVVNRGTSTIQVYEPSDMTLLGNFSVGPGSNPQDLVIHNNEAYITRYDANQDESNDDDLFVVDPINGTLITSLDLTSFTDDDGERLARATQMQLVGNTLYILIQDLSGTFKATTVGKVAILDTATKTFVDADLATPGTQAIVLSGRNPTSVAYNSPLNQLFITDTGYFDDALNNDTSTAFGGIEVINVATNTTEGIQIDDAAFGGYLFSMDLVGATLGVVTVEAETVATFNPTTLSIVDTNIYSTTSGFLPEILVDGNGLLWVPERNPTNDGMVLIDPAAGTLLAGPFPIGALPASMTLIQD